MRRSQKTNDMYGADWLVSDTPVRSSVELRPCEAVLPLTSEVFCSRIHSVRSHWLTYMDAAATLTDAFRLISGVRATVECRECKRLGVLSSRGFPIASVLLWLRNLERTGIGDTSISCRVELLSKHFPIGDTTRQAAKSFLAANVLTFAAPTDSSKSKG